MKNFNIISTGSVTLRVTAVTTYPRQSGMAKQIPVTVYAGGSRELSEGVVRELKAAKVEKHTFRCMGCEVTFSRYTDSHFTVRKWGVTQKVKSAFYHSLLEEFRNSSDWYEI
jgi:hypothetical protein